MSGQSFHQNEQTSVLKSSCLSIWFSGSGRPGAGATCWLGEGRAVIGSPTKPPSGGVGSGLQIKLGRLFLEERGVNAKQATAKLT